MEALRKHLYGSESPILPDDATMQRALGNPLPDDQKPPSTPRS